jgi:hypothetical protein
MFLRRVEVALVSSPASSGVRVLNMRFSLRMALPTS